MMRICDTFAAIAVGAMLLAQTDLAAQETQRTTVVKTLSSNPTLGVVKFQGSMDASRRLEDTFARCGWFTVLPSPQAETAAIRVTADVTDSTASFTVASGAQSFQVKGAGADASQAIYQAVDAVLEKLFDVKALCSQKIYYVVTDANNIKEIFCCYLDGTGQERVTFNNAISTEPSFGHKGALVYTLAKNNALAILLSDLQNHRQRIISQEPGLNASAGLSRDGAKLALPLSMEGQVDLYMTDFRTGTRTRLTRDRSVESSPCWSPDGERIVFTSDRLGVPQLYLMEAKANAKATRLTPGYNEAVSPDWSNISNKLCFSMKRNGQYVIAVIDMADETRQITVITHAAGNWEEPSWAPDGRHIVCARKSAVAGASDLYILDSWQATFQPISKGANLTLPAWRPAY